MKLTNYEIYNFAISYRETFAEFTAYIPAKANFRLQKNINALAAAASELDKLRVEILTQYGEERDGQIVVPAKHSSTVNQELNDLFSQEQELDIQIINIDAFSDVEFTPAQMQTLMFMIEG